MEPSLQQAPEPDALAARFRELLQQHPDHAPTHFNLGNRLMALGRYREAAASYLEAVRLAPRHAEAHSNLGVALAEQGLLHEAVGRYEQALQCNPDHADAHFNRANALKALGQLEAAADGYRQALGLRPHWPAGHNNLGLVLMQAGSYPEAVASYEQALRLAPDYAEAHNNLALCLQAQSILDRALAHFDRALQMQPDFAAAHANRAQLWLLLGHYRRGWPEYEWRWRLPGVGLPPLDRPFWNGASLDGKTVLLRAEQGLGDTLQFVRYAPLVRGRGGRVLLECQPSLVPLLQRCRGLEDVLARGSDLPAFDVQIPLLSLPGLLHTTLGNVPAEVPYLFADPNLVKHWHAALQTDNAFKIGIAWKGNTKYPGDRQRSVPLENFLVLCSIPGVRLYSLQKGQGSEQLAGPAQKGNINDLGSQLDAVHGAFMDTAAVMQNLDLIITADTATAHLAGGLGLPVWVPLSVACDWRWLIDREDSPWYPTLRLFRQTTLDLWDDVFMRLADSVRQRMHQPG